MKQSRAILISPRSSTVEMFSLEKNRWGKYYPYGEVIFVTGPRAAGTLARSDPPGSADRTPTPGILIGAVRSLAPAAGRPGRGAVPIFSAGLDHADRASALWKYLEIICINCTDPCINRAVIHLLCMDQR